MGIQRASRRWMSSVGSTNSPAGASPPRFPRVVDAHCHLHDPRLRGRLGAVARWAREWNVSHVVSCACYEEDWTRLDTLVTSFQDESGGGKVDDHRDDRIPPIHADLQVIPSFGVHPWWAHTLTSESLALLQRRLEQHPNALLGEIGLCKSARGKQVDLSIQEHALRTQLELAVDLQRGCVIHCVGAFGKLLGIMQETLKKKKSLPPVVVLHSYSGPADMVAAFLALTRHPHSNDFKIFFSLNAKQLASTVDLFTSGVDNQAKPSKVEAVCLKVPLDTLLLETDSPDQSPALDVVHELYGFALPEEFKKDQLNEPALVQLAICGAAAIRQISAEELAAAVYANSCRAFGIAQDRQ